MSDETARPLSAAHWYHVGRPWTDKPGLIYADSEDPHAGRFVVSVDDWTDETTETVFDLAEHIVGVHNASLDAARANVPALDVAWADLEMELARHGSDWHIVIENHESGDGHSEPHYEAYRAVAELGHAFPAYLRRVEGQVEGDVGNAVRSLVARLAAARLPAVSQPKVEMAGG